MLVGVKKSFGLSSSPFVQFGVYTASLYNTLTVVVGFAVADKVDRFTFQ